jgi:hypothetical protein|tara:strand:+ start:602 stop:1111 length:510 start_codon:yes stop_codon:yes gene_type:complete
MKIKTEILDAVMSSDVDALTGAMSTDEIQALLIQGEMGLLKEQSADLKEKLQALLPIATESEMVVILACAKDESSVPEGYKVGFDFILTADQKADLKEVKEERVRWCADHKDEVIQEIANDDEEVMTSYKVKVNAKRTETRKQLTFVKKSGKDQVKLAVFMERLRNMQE